MKKSYVIWQGLSYLFISLLISIIAPVIANLFMEKKGPKLEYTTIEAKPFKALDHNFAVYNIIIRNTGDEYISDIKSLIQIPSAELKEVIITADPNLDYSKTTLGDSLRLEIQNLNPAETVAVSTWAISRDNLPGSPNVSVRAKGMTGIQTTLTEEKQPNNLFIGILTFVAIWVAFSAVYLIRRVYPSRRID